MRYMFTMMNNARLSVGRRGPVAVAERAYQQAVAYAAGAHARAAPSAPPAGEPEPDRRAPRRAPDAADDARPHRGHAGRSPTPTPGAIDLAKARRRRRRAAQAARSCADLLTPITKGWGTDLGVELTSLARPGPRRHGLHRGDRRRRSTTATPASPRSTRAPTASRRWTWSAASCPCGPAASSPSTWRPMATGDEPSPLGGDLAPIGERLADAVAALRDGHRLAAGQRPQPTRRTRWPGPRPTCGMFGTVHRRLVPGPPGPGRQPGRRRRLPPGQGRDRPGTTPSQVAADGGRSCSRAVTAGPDVLFALTPAQLTSS